VHATTVALPAVTLTVKPIERVLVGWYYQILTNPRFNT